MKLYEEYIQTKDEKYLNEFFIIFPLSWITGPLKVLYRTMVIAFDKCVRRCGVSAGDLIESFV